ncbi:MAG: type I-U CRISPR-associated helicase/endonuclease Cas3 [Verrucomicrobiales bacterium]|nr:type I-U CRISPR-associated helicase/endonuclease Cas3 [Verrucomicrobiales bacterium]
MANSEFGKAFAQLTGYSPLLWQERLFREHFAIGDLSRCQVIDLPTGLGKTMVMAIWLIAREVNKDLPRRLIYVVDRRTVVDQATDVALKLQKSVGASRLAISTLRGQLADNREWSRDPSRPAIIIGTVDLIGSALLFSGYRSSYKRRPLEAGLLGQDSLLVLDEAHLSKPFEKLLKSITQFQHDQGSPMRVIRMSATRGDSTADKVFRLDTDPNSATYDLKPDPDSNTGEERNQIITRLNAKKRLTMTTTDEVIHSIATSVGDILTSHPNSRIVIFVKTPKEVDDVRKALIKKDKAHETKIALLTGTMRGLERDELVTPPTELDQHERRVMQRFLNPDNDTSQGECFLISTSAGEVGFDLNADHMVCDAAPIDSMIQRLGRVNRRGEGNATIILVVAKDPSDKSEIDKRCIEATKLLSNGMDVSPQALARLTSEQLRSASTPEPTMVELTDILLDAWSMTSITERMPGRPEVAGWLRGIADDLPQTTIAWRAELDLFKDHPNPRKAFRAIFAKHRIRAHESFTTNSYRVVEFLKVATSQKKGRPELLDTRVVIKFSRDLIVTTIGDLIDNPGPVNADPTLILPATLGGLDRGMLSHEAIAPIPKPDDPPLTLDVADKHGYEPREDARPRLRILIERTDDGWNALPLQGGDPIPADLNLDPFYETSTLLFKAIAETDLRVRLVQPVLFDDEGNPVRSLVILAPVGDKSNSEEQLLTEHVGAVETQALRIAVALGLEDSIREALLFAAKWHDEGKKADIWQRFIGGPRNGHPLGKAATTRDPKSLRGYRHEFGSLLRIHHPNRHATACNPPPEPETCDLALHLIATHHGFGRPHFDNRSDRDFQSKQCDAIHADAIRRFARLQRKYGWWQLAWLENLLRSADALASADPDAEDDDGNESSDEAGAAK